MPNAEFAERSKLVSMLSEMFARSYSVEALKAFLGATEDIPLKDFRAGITKATRICEFMPTPAKFRELAVGVPLLPRAAEINAAENARWGGKAH